MYFGRFERKPLFQFQSSALAAFKSPFRQYASVLGDDIDAVHHDTSRSLRPPGILPIPIETSFPILAFLSMIDLRITQRSPIPMLNFLRRVVRFFGICFVTVRAHADYAFKIGSAFYYRADADHRAA